jgi:aminobenzoyl-glutamate transport protein
MASEQTEERRSLLQRMLDLVERVGNRVPHPVLIFLTLILLVIGLSHVLYLSGASVSYDVVNVETHEIERVTTEARSLLTADGVRNMVTGLVPNFMGFTAIGLLIVAMVGVGVAEESGLINVLIRTLVAVSPGWALTYILAFVGILSSIASDAGYVVLIPLAGAAYASLGRHPLAGIALGFAAVAGAFNVNMLIKPLDAVMTEITNDAIHMVDPTRSIDLMAGFWFSVASVPFLVVVIALITDRLISPRLGAYSGEAEGPPASAERTPAETRGLIYAGLGLVAVLVLFGFLSLPEGTPLRNPETDALIGNSPLMNGLIVPIMLVFLVMGTAYGVGAGTIKSATEVIAAMVKAVSGLGGTIVLFLVISQFIAYFNYSNIPTLMAIRMADSLKSANVDTLWLLLGFILVVTALNIVFTPAIAKWAIFAPVFVPLFVTLGVDPAAVLSAYRVGDSPTNSITPLNAYFALVVGFARHYDAKAGIGTIVALMLPYAFGMAVLWTGLFTAWYLLGLPWGLQ